MSILHLLSPATPFFVHVGFAPALGPIRLFYTVPKVISLTYEVGGEPT